MGGQFDNELSADTTPFFEDVIAGRLLIIISNLLEAELLREHEHVKQFLDTIPKTSIERIQLTEEGAQLADEYINATVVGKISRANCQHIATATITHADVLESWNFSTL